MSHALLPLLPVPRTCVQHATPGCHLSADTVIVAEPGTHPEAELLSALVARVLGRPLRIVDSIDAAPAHSSIRLVRMKDAGQPPESYHLDVTAAGVVIQAATSAGIGWGIQTLVQLLPPHAPGGAAIPALTIGDQPRFSWRGAMLDPARHFIPVDDVLRFIDVMARHKLNRLHLHLTDDQGWRMEIRRYPRLTSVGAWRPETVTGQQSPTTYTFDGIPHGGFYTQDDCRRIVAYAATRHITVVPEIDLPGHMQAAIAAYPWLGNDGIDCGVFTRWGINPHILNAEERTFRFLEDVLGEVMDIFPSPWIHIGGDEAVKDEWKSNARIQERIRELACGDEHGLQSHIIRRMDDFITAQGRRMIGWEEIAEGGLSPRATVMSWQGFTAGVAAAQLGHEVIMAPVSHTYFDHGQYAVRNGQTLPAGSYLPLEKTYSFEPIPPELSEEQGRRILGGQGQMWSERISTRDQFDRMAFPRLCALAEVLWSTPAQRNWTDFQQRLPTHLARLEALGIAYSRPGRE